MDTATLKEILNSSGRKWPKEFEQVRIAEGCVSAYDLLHRIFAQQLASDGLEFDDASHQDQEPRDGDWGTPIRQMTDREVIEELTMHARDTELLSQVRDRAQNEIARKCKSENPTGRFRSINARKLANSSLWVFRKLKRGEMI
jgi:hypothetical protein